MQSRPSIFSQIPLVMATAGLLMPSLPFAALAQVEPEQAVACEVLIVGGGLAGAAAAYEALMAGRTVCLTELTDWLGGQISSQGTSALDERATQRSLRWYSRGYLELRQRIEDYYGELNPGDCWVSESCFFPGDGHRLLADMLEDAAKEGDGELKWFPSTVIKDLDIADGQIQRAIAIQHTPAPNAPPLNTLPLSQTLEDWYRYEDSPAFEKTILEFVPPAEATTGASWYVIDASETGELIGLADVPYRLGIDPRSHLDPTSSSETNDPYCPQGFTYTFAMEQTEEPQPQEIPAFYPQYEPYYSYELERFDFETIFTYRRIWSPSSRRTPNNRYGVKEGRPGDISMQNWTWGNDYRPGTSIDNLIYSREQLEETGQLQPGGWMGGLRTDTLRSAEEIALGFYTWIVAGTTDSQLGDGVKQLHPNHRFLAGLDSPMGTEHGLSKYPYMREGRRVLGRPAPGYPEGFSISEIDITRRDFADLYYYQETLPPAMYRSLRVAIAGLEATSLIRSGASPDTMGRRTRSTIYPDSVGMGHYAIDFHPCMALSPVETPGNIERPGERLGADGNPYPFQIPLRSMIPQEIDNLLIAGKSIATSHIVAAAYRVHSFEWSSGAAVGTVADVALDAGVMPYEMVDDLPRPEPELEQLQQRLIQSENPIAFPDTSIFNNDWEDWR